MLNKNKSKIINFLTTAIFSLLICSYVYAQDIDAPQMEKGMTFWQLLISGGWIMLIIALLSVAAVALIVELFLKLRPSLIMPLDFLMTTKEALKSGDVKRAQDLCSLKKGFLANIIRGGLDKAGYSLKAIQDAMTETGAKEATDLQQRVAYLSSIGTISPMLGLLGTVLGMIKSFNIIAFQAGLGKPTLLAGGVAQALVTTAFGLIVGIPAMGFYFYFRNRLEKIIADAEIVAGDVSLLLTKKETEGR